MVQRREPPVEAGFESVSGKEFLPEIYTGAGKKGEELSRSVIDLCGEEINSIQPSQDFRPRYDG
jgi:hypothetical protein